MIVNSFEDALKLPKGRLGAMGIEVRISNDECKRCLSLVLAADGPREFQSQAEIVATQYENSSVW